MTIDRRRGERRDKTNSAWQPMVDHINATWKARKGWAKQDGPEFNYPFMGRDFKLLKHWARAYMETGIMSLWDAYLDTADDWTKEHGFSIQNFERQLPRLVDDYAWKTRREAYDAKFPSKIPPKVIELFPSIGRTVPPPRKVSHNERWALKNPGDPRAKKYLPRAKNSS